MPAQPTICSSCPAAGKSVSFVPFDGPRDARVLVVGQGPGDTEAALGSPFIGPSGKLLDKWLMLAGIDRTTLRVGNTVLCWMPKLLRPPKGNRPPQAKEMAFCREHHWGGEVAGREVIIAVGVPAMKQFFGPRASERTAGQFARHPSGAWVVGLAHPSFILQGGWGQETAQVQTLRRVAALLAGTWQPPTYDYSAAPPNALLYPTLDDLLAWEDALGAGEPVAVDVENAGWVQRMVGLTACHSLRHVALHWRQGGLFAGQPWRHCAVCGGRDGGCAVNCPGGVDNFEAVVEWAYRFFEEPSVGKIFHNGFHDIEMLEEVGFEVNGYLADTIFMAHLAMPEARKRLENVATITACMGGWKAFLDEGGGHWK